MQHEGIDKRISFGGITRNTSESTCQDGEFDEIVNLRWKDGRFIPMNDQQEVDGLQNKQLQYKYVYVHANKYQHFIGYYEGAVWYFADMDDNGKVELLKEPIRLQDVTLTDEVGIQYTQTGNIVTILDGNSLSNIYWRNGAYVSVSSNYDGAETDTQIPPEGLISFRLTPKPSEQGSDTVRVVMSDWFGDYGNSENVAKMALSTCISSRGISRKNGEPTGYFYVCTAVKLFDGTYILQSRPVLMRPPEYNLDKNNNTEENRFFNFRKFYRKLNSSEKASLVDVATDDNPGVKKSFGEYNDDGTPGITYFDCPLEGWKKSTFLRDQAIGHYFMWKDYEGVYSQKIPVISDDYTPKLLGTKESKYKYRGVLAKDIPDLFCVTDGGSNNNIAPYNYGSWASDPVNYGTYASQLPDSLYYNNGLLRAVEQRGTNAGIVSGISRDAKTGTRPCMVLNKPHKLQYKFESTLDKSYEDLIESVCIFMTQEVECFTINEEYALTDVTNNLIAHYSRGNDNFKDVGKRYVVAPQHKKMSDINDELLLLKNYYRIAEIPFEECVKGGWIDIDLKSGAILENLVQQPSLQIDSVDRASYSPKASLMFNGRLHIANYTRHLFSGYPLNYFAQADFFQTSKGCSFAGKDTYESSYIMPNTNDASRYWVENGIPSVAVVYYLETNEGSRIVKRYQFPSGAQFKFPTSLNPILSYPDSRCKKMKIVLQWTEERRDADKGWCRYFRSRTIGFKMESHPLGFAFYEQPEKDNIDLFASDLKDKGYDVTDYELLLQGGYSESNQPYYNDNNVWKINTEESYTDEYLVNGLKASHTDNPLYFPAEYTYKVGNQSILAMATNAIKVSDGQVGDMPLYVFANDGLYGLFVDSSGNMAYKTSRPISRDVCVNWRSVTYTDAGVAFATDRGIKIANGSDVADISDPVEGNYFDFTNPIHTHYNTAMLGAITNDRLVQLKQVMTKERFNDYIKGCVIGYNHRDRELWISNPSKPYSYVLSNNIWIKRNITCDEYVSNYPETYMLKDGRLTTLGKETESGNQVMFLTRPIKFDSQDFKQSFRSILRSYQRLHDTNDMLIKDVYASEVNMTPDVKDIALAEYKEQTLIAEANSAQVRAITVDKVDPEKIVINDTTPQEQTFEVDDTQVVAYEKKLRVDNLASAEIEYASTPSGTKLVPYKELIYATNNPTEIHRNSQQLLQMDTISELSGYDRVLSYGSFSLQIIDGDVHLMFAPSALILDLYFSGLPSYYHWLKVRVQIVNACYNVFGTIRLEDGREVSVNAIRTNGAKGKTPNGMDNMEYNDTQDKPTGWYYMLESDVVILPRSVTFKPVDVCVVKSKEELGSSAVCVVDSTSFNPYEREILLGEYTDEQKSFLVGDIPAKLEFVKGLRGNAFYDYRGNCYEVSKDNLNAHNVGTNTHVFAYQDGYFGEDELNDPSKCDKTNNNKYYYPKTYSFSTGGIYALYTDCMQDGEDFRWITTGSTQPLDMISSILRGNTFGSSYLSPVSNGVINIGGECYLKFVDEKAGKTDMVRYVGNPNITYSQLRSNIDNNKYQVFTEPLEYVLHTNDIVYDSNYKTNGGYVLKYIGGGETINYDQLLSYCRSMQLPSNFVKFACLPTSLVQFAIGTNYARRITSIKKDGVEQLDGGDVVVSSPSTKTIESLVDELTSNPDIDRYATSIYHYGSDDVEGISTPKRRELNEGNYHIEVYDASGVMDEEYHVQIPVGEYNLYELFASIKEEEYKQYTADRYIEETNKPLVECSVVPCADGEEVRLIVPGYEDTQNIVFHAEGSFTLSQLITYLSLGIYEKADIVTPSQLTLTKPSIVVVDIEGEEHRVYIGNSVGSIDYDTLIQGIRNGTFGEYVTSEVDVHLEQDKSYALEYHSDNEDYEREFTYKGDTTDISALELIEALKSGSELYTDIDASTLYVPGTLDMAEKESISLYDKNSNNTYSVEYSGDTTIETSRLIYNCATGVYPKIAVTKWQDDLLQLDGTKNIKFVDLEGNETTFFNEQSRSITYTQLVSTIDEQSEPKTIGDMLLSLIDEDYYHIIYTDKDGQDREYNITYNGDTIVRFADLLERLDNGEFQPIPESNQSASVMIPANKIVIFHDFGGTNYIFSIDDEQTENIYVKYNVLVEEMSQGKDTGVIADLNGNLHNYTKREVETSSSCKAGIYVFGSYDARKWQFLGGNELSGSFRDLGCLTERVDCKYFRVLYVGNVSYDSTYEYIDMSVENRLLNKKMR